MPAPHIGCQMAVKTGTAEGKNGQNRHCLKGVPRPPEPPRNGHIGCHWLSTAVKKSERFFLFSMSIFSCNHTKVEGNCKIFICYLKMKIVCVIIKITQKLIVGGINGDTA